MASTGYCAACRQPMFDGICSNSECGCKIFQSESNLQFKDAVYRPDEYKDVEYKPLVDLTSIEQKLDKIIDLLTNKLK